MVKRGRARVTHSGRKTVDRWSNDGQTTVKYQSNDDKKIGQTAVKPREADLQAHASSQSGADALMTSAGAPAAATAATAASGAAPRRTMRT